MSAAPKFTPGPWEVVDGSEVRAGGDVLCDVIGNDARARNDAWREQREANARLIAAAPELYEACMRCVEHMEWSTPQGESAYAATRAALAKARGES